MNFGWTLRFRSVFAALMLSVGVFSFAMPVAASAVAEYRDVKVVVQMDKEQYEEDEPITATITAVNTGSQSVTIVNLEQLIPEGYVLAEDSQAATGDVEMKPGQTIVLRVTFEGEPAQPTENGASGSFWDKLFYGETLGIPNIILAVVIVIIVIIFMVLT